MTHHLLFRADGDILDWMEGRVGFSLRPARAIGLVEQDEDGTPRLLAAVAYNRVNSYSNAAPHDVCMTIVSTTPRWASRRAIGAFFRYPFIDLEMRRVTAAVASDNAPSLKMMDQLGFKAEGVIRHGYDGFRDAVVFGMLREECRWLDAPGMPAIIKTGRARRIPDALATHVFTPALAPPLQERH